VSEPIRAWQRLFFLKGWGRGRLKSEKRRRRIALLNEKRIKRERERKR
jgi:hypothetical protein